MKKTRKTLLFAASITSLAIGGTWLVSRQNFTPSVPLSSAAKSGSPLPGQNPTNRSLDAVPKSAARAIEGTAPLAAHWLAKHRVPADRLGDDPNGDGISNREHMMAGTDPFAGTRNPYPFAEPDLTHLTAPVGEPGWNERKTELRKLLAQVAQDDRQSLKQTTAEAERRGFSRRLGSDGRALVLGGFGADGEPIYLGPANIALADTSGIDELWPTGAVTAVSGWTTGSSGLNLSGAGQTLAMWDLGDAILENHTQFSGRARQLDAAGPATNHATAVAGAMAASGATYFSGTLDIGNHSRGAAYAAGVNGYDTALFDSEFLAEGIDSRSLANLSVEILAGWVEVAGDWRWYGNPSSLESHLFGNYLSGTSGLEPRNIDLRVNNVRRLLPVFAASNNRGESGTGEGPGDPGGSPFTYTLDQTNTASSAPRVWADGDEGGYDTLSPSGVAKNILTVGACYDIPGGYNAATDVIEAPFTAFGPTDDGRIKPEIVAAGIRDADGARNPLGLENAVELGFNSSDPTNLNLYSEQQGTSMASPIVTGGLGLVLQRRHQLKPAWETNEWPIQASTLRGLAVHTASEAGPSRGPDFKFGYGLFNALAATQLMGADAAVGNKPHVKEILIAPFTTSNFKIKAVDPNKPLKITIAWTDPAGPASAAGVVDPALKRLVHDLNLSVTGPAGTHLPWVLKPDLAGKTAAIRSQGATRGVDTLNNLEQVEIDAPSVGVDYTVNITTTGAIAAPGQWVSVLLSNDTTPVPVFAVTTFQPYPNSFWYLAWNTVPGGIYRVQASPDLTNWSDVSGDISARADSTSTLVSAPGVPPSYFWRVARYY